MLCEKLTGEVPVPSADPPEDGARVPKLSFAVPGFVAEYRNHPVVAAPSGLPVPFSVAELAVTDVAALVVTTGGPAVVKLSMLPKAVPSELLTMAQK